MTEKIFVMVVSMWGHTAEGEWVYIGNQSVLNQDLTEKQCESMGDKKQWKHFSNNPYYGLKFQCYPKDCQGKEKCD